MDLQGGQKSRVNEFEFSSEVRRNKKKTRNENKAISIRIDMFLFLNTIQQ